MSDYVKLGDVHAYYEEDGKGRRPRTPAPWARGLAGLRGIRAGARIALPLIPARQARTFGAHPGRRGPDHFPVVTATLDRMHREEPTLTVADLAGYTRPALVVVGHSDEEIPIEHTLALREGLPD